MTQMTESAARPAGGIRLDAEEERYRERTPRSRDCSLHEAADPDRHGGGMSVPYIGPARARRAAGSGTWMGTVSRPSHRDGCSSTGIATTGSATRRRAAREGLQFGSPDRDLSYRMASLLTEQHRPWRRCVSSSALGDEPVRDPARACTRAGRRSRRHWAATTASPTTRRWHRRSALAGRVRGCCADR